MELEKSNHINIDMNKSKLGKLSISQLIKMLLMCTKPVPTPRTYKPRPPKPTPRPIPAPLEFRFFQAYE